MTPSAKAIGMAMRVVHAETPIRTASPLEVWAATTAGKYAKHEQFGQTGVTLDELAYALCYITRPSLTFPTEPAKGGIEL